MKKYIALLLSALIFLPATYAQLTHTASGTTDVGATGIIKKASAKFSGTVVFTVTVVSYDANRKETFRQKADVLYQAPRYRLKAGTLEIYCDGTSTWQVNKAAKEVVVSPIADSDDDLTNPARLLANYSKNYRAKFIRQEKDGTSIVDLQPNKSRSYHKIRLYIGPDNQLKKLEQHNYDSSRNEYSVSNFKNTAASASDFTFNPAANPSYELIDMR